MFYIVKTPQWATKLFASYIWKMPPNASKAIYLTFDDGPHPEITTFVLEELRKYNAKATFFCIGKNVVEHPLVYKNILNEGHAVGNHTHNHLNGWKTPDSEYLENVLEAKKCINSSLFRPPYGRIKKSQREALMQNDAGFQIVMWSVLSGDFDVNITPEACCNNVLKNTKSGSIVVFHDSEKAYSRLQYALPIVLKYFTEKGYLFEKIELRK